MPIRDIFKINRKTFFNPSGWIDLNALIYQNQILVSILGLLFAKPGAPTAGETFEDAMRRQGVTEKDIADGISTYRALAVVFLLLGVVTFLYAGYLIFQHTSLTGCLLALVVAALFGAQAFKYDFWAFQMRSRRLGLTFADWKRQYLG